MDREDLLTAHMFAGVVQAAGHHGTAGPLLGKFLLLHPEGMGRGQPGLGLEAKVHTLIGKVIQVHAAVRHQGKAQAGGIIEFGQMDALALAVEQPGFPDAGDLVHISQFFQQLCMHINTPRE